MTKGGLIENRPYMLDQTAHRSRLVIDRRGDGPDFALACSLAGKNMYQAPFRDILQNIPLRLHGNPASDQSRGMYRLAVRSGQIRPDRNLHLPNRLTNCRLLLAPKADIRFSRCSSDKGSLSDRPISARNSRKPKSDLSQARSPRAISRRFIRVPEN